jgi:radical SAM superfamily enzyme YgiQ (UPF0313 family)
MKIAIMDSNYSRPEHIGLAASWLRWEIDKTEHELVLPIEADVVFITASSQQAVSDVRCCIKKIDRSKSKVHLGGGCGYAPAIFDGMVDAVCCGEGKRFVRTILSGGSVSELPETWIAGEQRQVIPSQDFPWDCPPIMHPDGVVRVFASRGCKHKCMFCQTGWERNFIPHTNAPDIQKQCADIRAAGYDFDLVTNDGGDIHGIENMRAVSIRFDKLKKLLPLTRTTTKTVRIGVEGVSERIRSAVNKPIQNDELLEVSRELLSVGINVRWFFVVGLPMETVDDYLELSYLARQLKSFNKGTVSTVFHAYIPQPATPLCVFPLVDEYWEPFDEWRRNFFHGDLHSNRLQIVAPAQYKTRMKNAMTSMAATEDEIRRGWFEHDNKNWRVKTLLTNINKRKAALQYAESMKRTSCAQKPPAENQGAEPVQRLTAPCCSLRTLPEDPATSA